MATEKKNLKIFYEPDFKLNTHQSKIMNYAKQSLNELQDALKECAVVRATFFNEDNTKRTAYPEKYLVCKIQFYDLITKQPLTTAFMYSSWNEFAKAFGSSFHNADDEYLGHYYDGGDNGSGFLANWIRLLCHNIHNGEYDKFLKKQQDIIEEVQNEPN